MFILAVAFSACQIAISGVHSLPAGAEVDKLDLDIVILVDESRSLSSGDVRAERSAVSKIVQNQFLFGKGIRFSIVPFSSGPQSPRKLEGCQAIPLTVDTSSILSACADQIVRQTNPTQSNTDFASAIKVATEILASDSDRVRAVILLTDGQFDPDGDERVSAKEQEELDEALDRARAAEVSLWGLGFGRANLKALTSYSLAAAQVSSSCTTAPESVIASVTDLNSQMNNLIAALTCLPPPPPPRPTPVIIEVSPLVNQLALSVTTEQTPQVTDGLGYDPCKEQWTENIDSTFDCLLSLDGSNAGEWSVRTDGRGSVTYNSHGDLVGRLDACDSAPILNLERLDKSDVNWEAEVDWPMLDGFLVGENGETLDTFKVSADRPKIVVPIPGPSLSNAARIEIQLPRDSKDSLAYNMPRVSCDLRPALDSTVPATSPETTSVVNNPQTPDTPPTSHLPWWVWLIGVLVVMSGGLLGLRARRNRLFPVGTVVRQESLDSPGIFVELEGEIAGKRRVSLRRSGGRFLSLEPYGDSADVVLSRSGQEVLVEYPTGEASDDGKAIIERTSTPFGIALRIQGYVIRVDIPEGLEDEF